MVMAAVVIQPAAGLVTGPGSTPVEIESRSITAFGGLHFDI
jgi:hypothetical protein